MLKHSRRSRRENFPLNAIVVKPRLRLIFWWKICWSFFVFHQLRTWYHQEWDKHERKVMMRPAKRLILTLFEAENILDVMPREEVKNFSLCRHDKKNINSSSGIFFSFLLYFPQHIFDEQNKIIADIFQKLTSSGSIRNYWLCRRNWMSANFHLVLVLTGEDHFCIVEKREWKISKQSREYKVFFYDQKTRRPSGKLKAFQNFNCLLPTRRKYWTPSLKIGKITHNCQLWRGRGGWKWKENRKDSWETWNIVTQQCE